MENAARALFNDNLMFETRGDSKPKLEELKSKIIDHIQSFKCREWYYGKVSEFNRIYLPYEFNVRKMHKIFLGKYSVSCKYHYYYDVFRTKFNLGFGTLKIDTCSTCETFKNKMKLALDDDLRKTMVVEQLVHKTRVRRFFQELNKVPERTITINFDLMQNMLLLRTQIGEA